MPDDVDFVQWLLALLERHSRDIHWRELPEPLHEGGRIVTHEGILELPDVGCVHAYRLKDGEEVFNSDDLDRVLGLEDDDEACPFCGEDDCERSCTGALLEDEGKGEA